MLLPCLKGSHDLLLTPHPHLISCQFFSYCPSLSHIGLLAVLWRHQPHSHSQPFYCYTRQAHSFFRWLCLVDRGVCPNTPFSQRRLFHCSAVSEVRLHFPYPCCRIPIVTQVWPSDTPCAVWEVNVGQEEASLLVVMLLFPLEFHFSVASIADVPMSVAYVHT